MIFFLNAQAGSDSRNLPPQPSDAKKKPLPPPPPPDKQSEHATQRQLPFRGCTLVRVQ